MKLYDLIVFDWDGTVMDSESRIVTCMQLAAQHAGLDTPQDAEVREIIGLSLPRAAQVLFPEADERAQLEVLEGYRKYWWDPSIPESALFADAEQCLRELSGAGYGLAVATGKSRRGLDEMLEVTGLGSLFDMTRCADESFSKPHPQMLQDIFVDLNVAAPRALMVGDTEYDLQMAANAGAAAVGVSYGAHSAARLHACGALRVFDQLSDLPVWLAEQTERR